MSTNTELWRCYFNNFISHKLELVDQGCAPETESDFAQQILSIYFEYLDDKEDGLRKITELHTTYQLEIARLVTVLRPLNKIQRVRNNNI